MTLCTHRVALLLAAAECMTALACAKAEPPPPVSAATTEHVASPERVRLSQAVIRDTNIETKPVVMEVLSAVLPLSGEIIADPDKSARLSSPAAGRIELVSFREGAVVKKGDVLAVIRIPELGKLRGSYAATRDKATAARSNANRLKDLSEHRVAAAQVYIDAEAAAAALEAEANALGEQLATIGAPSGGGATQLALRAPISGVVLSRDAITGQPVTPERTLGTIADLAEVWFMGHVYEKDLARVHIGSTATIDLTAYPREPFDGVVEYVSQQIEPASRSFTVRIRVANRAGLLRIGLYGTARVTADGNAGKAPSAVVMRSSVVEFEGQSAVFVLEGDEFVRHDVVLGATSPDRVEVQSGVREGEQVVASGAFAVKSALLKSTLAE